MSTLLSKLRRQTKRWRKSKKIQLYTIVGLLCIGAVGYAIYMDNRRLSADPASYRPLLNLIARVESTDNYNAHFGNPSNTRVEFTSMSLEDVQQWQRDFVAQGNASSAVGRYQIIDTTLSGLISELSIDTQQKFSQETQDMLGVALLERRGGTEYVNRELSREEFAANLAMEWAALPKVIGENSDSSYYAGDGLNRALVDKSEVLDAVQQVRAQQ